MNKEDLLKLRKSIFNLTDEEKYARDLYLKQFYDSTLYGPLVDDIYISKPSVIGLREEPIYKFNVEENPFLILERKVKDEGLSDEKIIFSMDGKSKTYGQLYEETKKVALGLKNKGLKKGDTLGCIFLNSFDEASVFFAAMVLGVKIKYIDFTKGLNSVKKQLNETEINVIVMDDMFKMMIPFIYTKNVSYIIADNNKDYSLLNVSSLNAIMKNRNEELMVENDKNAPAIVITSSGTTGKPKPIIHSVYTLNCGVRKVMHEDFQLGPNNVITKVIPSHIAMGVVGILCSAIYSDTPVVMVRGKNAIECANNTMELVRDFKNFKRENNLPENSKLTLFSSPVFLKTIADNIDDFEDLSYLGTLLSAGSKLSEDVINYICEKISTKGCYSKPVSVYGQNEMHLQTANNDRVNKYGSVGVPTIGTNIIVVDDNNELVEPNVDGRILEQSDTTFIEYENSPEKTQSSFITLEDGSKWFDTQDKGFIDKDGYVYITGRFSRSMVRFDCKVSLETIEEKIKKHTDVKDCVMIALEEKNEEDNIPVLFLDVGSKKITFDKIVKDLKRKGIQFSEYEIPEFVEIVTMPYLSSQKADIQKLSQYAQKKYIKE
jgi:acyl-coenzyme A synthetase/AMP-(fatty) acid ligase